jgi:hypothetical protein
MFGRYADAAAKILYEQGYADTLVVTGAKQYGYKESFGALHKRELERRSKIPASHVVIAGEKERTTSMELKTYIKWAKKQGLNNIATLTLEVHKERTQRIADKYAKKAGIHITVLAAEDINTSPGLAGQRAAEFYSKVSEKMKQRNDYKGFVRHEEKAIYIEKAHAIWLFDNVVSRVYRPKIASK